MNTKITLAVATIAWVALIVLRRWKQVATAAATDGSSAVTSKHAPQVIARFLICPRQMRPILLPCNM